MGYTTRPGTQIQDFWPDDIENKFYISVDSIMPTMQEIFDRAQEKWLGISMEDITISADRIHTHCLGYDLYDPMDYTNFLVIERTQ